jgi:DNA ligase-1
VKELFKRTSSGAVESWAIKVKGNLIITTWGQVGGKLQVTSEIIKEGKNLGKKNATTPEQQAEAEADSRYEKKLKKGYVTTMKAAEQGKVDEIIEGGIFPMLAHKYSEHGDKIEFPAFIQPKLDGHRCIYTNGGLWSRTRKPILGVPHILKAIKEQGVDHLILDGELYSHDYSNNFEGLTSLIRSGTPKEGHEVVEYHVYDVVTPGTFTVRLLLLRKALSQAVPPIVFVETKGVYTTTAIDTEVRRYRTQGYEGGIVRNSTGLYEFKRSYNLQKVKEFDDAEFEVMGVIEGKGKLAGHGIMICKTADGKEFKVKMDGEQEKLKEYYDSPPIGQKITVRYQGLTKEGLPRFPVGLHVRKEE